MSLEIRFYEVSKSQTLIVSMGQCCQLVLIKRQYLALGGNVSVVTLSVAGAREPTLSEGTQTADDNCNEGNRTSFAAQVDSFHLLNMHAAVSCKY